MPPGIYARPSFAEAFWAKIDKSGERSDACWLWTAGKDRDGYGQFRQGRAHRIAWELTHGCRLPKGQVVCHWCDNPACVRPNHLWLGSHTSNIADRHNKGRTACGHKAGPAKLNEDQVAEIRSMYRGRYQRPSLRELGERYGVTHDCIWRIVHHLNWR